ncbi:MAG: ribosomal RNA small subunit methyltransferase I, partial [Vicinamibacterales bacterium]
VAVVSDAGTPTISDPGSHLIASAIEAGIRVESVPGPSAILALLAVSGLPTQPFTFLGFVPNRSKDRAGWIRRLKDVPGTSVFFESPHRLHQTLDAISDQYGECHIVVGRELTKVHEEVLRGPVSAVKKKLGEPRGEFCLAINLTMWAVSSDEPEGQAVDDAAIGACFRQITETAPLSRRAAIAAVSKRLGVAPNKIYAALERQKTSVE